MRITEDQEKFIIDNYKTMTQKEIADYLCINTNTVSKCATYHKLFKKKKQKFSESEIDFMIEHYLDMTYAEIGEVLGYTERQIRGKINNMGLRKTREFRNDYFHIIDSDIKAYFLGFIFADGWICKNDNPRNYEFGMELQSGDRYILDKLNEELGGVHKITHKDACDVLICGVMCKKNDSDTLRVYSRQLVEDLYSHGIDTNKSQKDTHPVVTGELFFDFLRGYIDGDGYYNRSYENKPYYMGLVCASKVPLIWIQSVLDTYDIHTSIYTGYEKKHRLVCHDVNSMTKLVSLLYHDNFSLCLTRKYDKIKHYLSGSAA